MKQIVQTITTEYRLDMTIEKELEKLFDEVILSEETNENNYTTKATYTCYREIKF